MSRLSAQADMEYLPSYGPTIAGLAQLFDNIGQLRDLAPIRLIDPCAGEGDALRMLADAIRTEYEDRTGRGIAKKQIETYGVELDTERARKARRKLKRVVQTDYFNTLVTPEAFNLMLLNPPYDYDPDFKRLEQRFLVRATQLLVTGGILIYMVPRYVLNTSAKFLARNYSGFRVWQEEGNPDAERFNQVMLVAVRNTSPANQTENRQSLERFAQGKVDVIGEDVRYDLVQAKSEVDRFTALRVDYADVLEEVSRTGYETRTEWRDMTIPPSNDIVEPLMPPRVGHMGLIMSGGGVGGLGIGLSNDDEATIFRAASKKVVDVEKENESGTVQRLTERMTSSAVTLDPSTWEFSDDVQLGEFVAKWSRELADYLAAIMPPKYSPKALRDLLGHAPEYHRLLRRPMPGNGQRLAIEGAMYSLLSGECGTTVVGEMGTGKTYISLAASYLAGLRRMFVLCPPTLVWKWEDEILKTIPGARVYVVGRKPVGPKARQEFYRLYRSPLKQIRWLGRNYGGQDTETPVYAIFAHSTAKLSYGRIPAIHWRWGYRPQPEYVETTGEMTHPKWRPFIEEVEVLKDGGDDAGDEKLTKVVRRKVQRMCCTECGQPILVGKDDEPAEWDWLARRRRFCANRITVGRAVFKDNMGADAYGTESRECGAPLWQALTNTRVSAVDTGFPTRGEKLKQKALRKYLYASSVDAEEALSYRGMGSLSLDYSPDEFALAEAGEREVFKTKQVPPRRYDLAEYIKRYMPDFAQLVINDEVHQFKAGNSVQGMMARMMSEIVPQNMSLTGTLMAGYARDLFHLLWGFGGRGIRRDFGHGEETRWRNIFGFVEKTIYLDAENSKRSRNKKQNSKPKDLPGAMPGVLRYILGQAVFIRLLDVAAGLPDFSEHSITVDLDETPDPVTGDTQKDVYQVMERRVREEIKSLTYTDPRAAAQLVSIYGQAVISYPDCCTQPEAAVIHSPADGSVLIDRPPLSADRLYPKEEKLLEIVKAEKEAGRKVLVFCVHTNKRDVMPRLADILGREGIRASVLRSNTVDADKRMGWLDEQLKMGLDALICHPQLVETGVDMLEFPTLVWHEADYNTARVRQASRRSWRIGQTQPVRIYYLTYGDSKQTQALYLIAQKVATSLAVEGDLSNDGLTALAGGDSMGRDIARMLVEGDFEFDGSFESGINIAALDTDAESEQLLVDDTDAWDVDFETEEADGLTADVAASLVTQTLTPTDSNGTGNEDAGDGFEMPLFGTLEPGGDALEVCDGCEQFILGDEQRIKTPAAESISSVDGVRIVPGRVFHTGCYGPWNERLKATADSNEPVEVAPPVNAAQTAPEPAADAPDPNAYGAVSMDAWLSAFDLTTEDMERGRRKRARRRNGSEAAKQQSLMNVH